MTVLNDLIRQAKAKPAFVELRWNHVSSLVEHMHAVQFGGKNMGRAAIRSEVLGGRSTICGIPIRVIGVPREILQEEIDRLQARIDQLKKWMP